MPNIRVLSALFRDRNAAHSNRVSAVELFFDLIFVFAVTQLSHLLLAHFTVLGGLETGLLLLAVWWVWMYTSWTTNWLNPETGPVRVMMLILAAVALVMSTAIPQAFTTARGGLIFAVAYVAMQVGRTLFMTLCSAAIDRGHFLNFLRVLLWLIVSAGFWIGGGLAPDYRMRLWTFAVFLEYVSPSLMFWVPGLGASDLKDWDVDGEHMAERCGLFVMIALGESVVVMGESFGHQVLSADSVTAFVTEFVTCIALWWLYFGLTAHKGTRAISHDALPGRLARMAYTYVHILLVAGIIVTAVGAEQVLADGHDQAALSVGLTVLGGPALFIFGNAVFIHVINGRIAPLHSLGCLALAGVTAALATGNVRLSVLELGAVAAITLGAVALLEPVLYAWRHRRVAQTA